MSFLKKLADEIFDVTKMAAGSFIGIYVYDSTIGRSRQQVFETDFAEELTERFERMSSGVMNFFIHVFSERELCYFNIRGIRSLLVGKLKECMKEEPIDLVKILKTIGIESEVKVLEADTNLFLEKLVLFQIDKILSESVEEYEEEGLRLKNNKLFSTVIGCYVIKSFLNDVLDNFISYIKEEVWDDIIIKKVSTIQNELSLLLRDAFLLKLREEVAVKILGFYKEFEEKIKNEINSLSHNLENECIKFTDF